MNISICCKCDLNHENIFFLANIRKEKKNASAWKTITSNITTQVKETNHQLHHTKHGVGRRENCCMNKQKNHQKYLIEEIETVAVIVNHFIIQNCSTNRQITFLNAV